MQAAVWWSHYSVSKNSLLLEVPPLDTSYIQRYNDNAYVQFVPQYTHGSFLSKRGNLRQKTEPLEQITLTVT